MTGADNTSAEKTTGKHSHVDYCSEELHCKDPQLAALRVRLEVITSDQGDRTGYTYSPSPPTYSVAVRDNSATAS